MPRWMPCSGSQLKMTWGRDATACNEMSHNSSLPTLGAAASKLTLRGVPTSCDITAKMSPEYRIRLTWIQSLLFLIAQTQRAAVQTAISQIPVRNFPPGLSPFAVMDCRSWNMVCQRQEIFRFFLSCIRSSPVCRTAREILMPIIGCCRWLHPEIVGVSATLGDEVLHHIQEAMPKCLAAQETL